MEKWVVVQKGADFAGIAERFLISPVTARLIRNREIVGDAAVEKYINGGMDDLYDAHLLHDADRCAAILEEKIKAHLPIRIIGDYDIDGVMATYILSRGLQRCGANVSTKIPDRMKDGYGVNDHLIGEAYESGIDTIITCDNGIAAIDEIAHAKELGMTVLVTDHHEIPYREVDGVRTYLRSAADAVVNPKQPECSYPYPGLCGAAVAWKVICLLYERCGVPKEEAYPFLEEVAFATVGDVVELTDENRILVKEGLRRIRETKNPGMRALIFQNKLTPEEITAYHIGYVLGPCVNAGGRLETAQLSLKLFLQEDALAAMRAAEQLVELNLQRKELTAAGVEAAKRIVEEGNAGAQVLVVYLPNVHESLAGIIAGRIREAYQKPSFVLTRAEDGVKGSGRSIETYSMYEELCKCRHLFTRFGGHPMAAGLSLPEEEVENFRREINEACTLTEEDFIPKVKIDIAMPADYPTEELVRELAILEPFGKGNAKPQFADKNLAILHARIVGKNQNVLKLQLQTERGTRVDAVYFGDVEQWKEYYRQKYGEHEVNASLRGQKNGIRMSVVYYPEINEYQGIRRVQLVIRSYQ